MSVFDLNKPPPDHSFKVSIDRIETKGERFVRLTKDLGVFLLATVFVSAIYWLAYNTVTSPTAGVDEKKWAMSVLSAGAA